MSIPRRYHRTLLGEKAIFIHDIETKTNSKVRFPDKETASDVVTVFGPESQVQMAAAMLLVSVHTCAPPYSPLRSKKEHVPFEADMAVPPSAELSRLCASPEFSSFIEGIKREYSVSITPQVKIAKTGTNGTTTDAPMENSFKFRCQRSNSDFLVTAREMLEQFLLNHNVHVYPSPTAHTHKRGDSFAEAFPHFESKLLSTSLHKTRGKRHIFLISELTDQVDSESADMALMRPPEAVSDRRLRMASSSPDVKALFNQPSYIFDLEEHENIREQMREGVRANHVSGQSLDYWTPLPPIVSSYCTKCCVILTTSQRELVFRIARSIPRTPSVVPTLYWMPN